MFLLPGCALGGRLWGDPTRDILSEGAANDCLDCLKSAMKFLQCEFFILWLKIRASGESFA
jgi:hypothetical protein